MNKIKLSVVVPSYNSSVYLPHLLDSIRAERNDCVEYLFMDGGSQDGTMGLVQAQKDLFAVIVSEKDKGQSDALNKGLRMAKGEFVTWLNADDCWVPGGVGKMLRFMQRYHSDWYVANMVYIDAENSITRCTRTGSFEELGLRMGILHVFGPSTIWRRSLLEELGYLDESFHYGMDTEYWFRMASSGYRYKRMNEYLWAFRLHEASKTSCTITSKTVPVPIAEEGRRIDDKYKHPLFRKKLRSFAVASMRLRRILCGAYPRAYFDTLRWRGRLLSEMRQK